MSEAAAARPNHLAAVPNSEDERLKLLGELVGKAAHHKDQALRHMAASKAAEAAILKLHGKRGSTIEVGDSKLTWKNPAKSFDKEAFVKAYPMEANAYFYKTPEPVPELDVSAIPPKLKETFMKPGSGEGTLVIK